MRDLKQLPKLVGAKQSKKALDDGQVAALIVARDAQQTLFYVLTCRTAADAGV